MNRYFYIDSEGKQKGTFSPEELKSENIKKDTLVWAPGMSEWVRASNVAELNTLFADNAGYNPPQPAAQSVIPPPRPVDSGASRQQQPMPKSWLIESILATVIPFLLCGSIFSLLGVIGIVHASKVESLYVRGDHAGSLEASGQARKWTKIAMWIGIAWVVLWIAAVVLLIAFGVSMAGISDVLSGSGYEI